MDKQTLKINLPEGWKVDFKIVESESPDGDVFRSEDYEIIPDAESIFSHIGVMKDLDGAPATPEELLEYSAQEYLDRWPESLAPGLEEFIRPCEIMGAKDACYCVFQEPHESAARIRVVFEAQDWSMVWVDADIKDWNYGCGEAEALDFLGKFFAL